jgi:hypothetical protein
MQPIDILAEMVNDMLGETASNLVCQHGVLYANDRADARAGEQCVLFVSKDVLRKNRLPRPNRAVTSG